jgi:hypothetical protein
MSVSQDGPYEPFIDDPRDVARFQGQRYVVLRPFGRVVEEFERVKNVIAERFQGLPISHVARPHVTLAGFPAGTSLDSVRSTVASWAPSVRPLTIRLVGPSFFPFRIAIVQVGKTPELADALRGLRLRALNEGPRCFAVVPVEEWVFHLSISYCHALSQGEWEKVTDFLGTLSTSQAECTVEEAEVVAFDDGREYSGGVYSFTPAPAV